MGGANRARRWTLSVMRVMQRTDLFVGASPLSRDVSMLARIYRPAKTAMQSGKAKSRDWRLEFEPASARVIDPLMGWTGSTDMNGQVRLTFETSEEAVAYAERHGIPFRLIQPNEPPMLIKSYADNFATNRKQSWTH